MTEESLYDRIEQCADALKLDFHAVELARLADERQFSPEQMNAVADVFDFLKGKKEQAVIDFLLKTSRLPMKVPKTFESFDFSRIHGKNADSHSPAFHVRRPQHNHANQVVACDAAGS